MRIPNAADSTGAAAGGSLSFGARAPPGQVQIDDTLPGSGSQPGPAPGSGHVALAGSNDQVTDWIEATRSTGWGTAFGWFLGFATSR